MDRIQVVHPGPKKQGTQKGFNSHAVFESDTDQVREVWISGGTTGGWHHHGKRTMYGYIVSGKANIEFGPKGQERAVLSPGDFFRIPPGLVHRDVNPNHEEVHILVFNMGEGLTSVEAPGPSSSS